MWGTGPGLDEELAVLCRKNIQGFDAPAFDEDLCNGWILGHQTRLAFWAPKVEDCCGGRGFMLSWRGDKNA